MMMHYHTKFDYKRLTVQNMSGHTDTEMDMVIPIYLPPPNIVTVGIKKLKSL